MLHHMYILNLSSDSSVCTFLYGVMLFFFFLSIATIPDHVYWSPTHALVQHYKLGQPHSFIFPFAPKVYLVFVATKAELFKLVCI